MLYTRTYTHIYIHTYTHLNTYLYIYTHAVYMYLKGSLIPLAFTPPFGMNTCTVPHSIQGFNTSGALLPAAVPLHNKPWINHLSDVTAIAGISPNLPMKAGMPVAPEILNPKPCPKMQVSFIPQSRTHSTKACFYPNTRKLSDIDSKFLGLF